MCMKSRESKRQEYIDCVPHRQRQPKRATITIDNNEGESGKPKNSQRYLTSSPARNEELLLNAKDTFIDEGS